MMIQLKKLLKILKLSTLEILKFWILNRLAKFVINQLL